MEQEKLFKPNVSEELAKEIAKRVYGLTVTNIRRFISYDDQNFHIQVSREHKNPYIAEVSEKGYVLKVTNTQKTANVDHFTTLHAAMIHLSKKGLQVPVPITTLKNETWTLENVPLLNEDETSEKPKYCGVHLLSFVDGTAVSTVECSSDVLYQWGRLLAKFHDAAEDFTVPNLHHKFVFWSLEQVPEIKNFMGPLTKNQKEIIYRVLNRYQEEIEQHLPNLPKGVIHGDFNENNVLVQKNVSESGDGALSVSGVLDFEDIQLGTYVWDVGVMLAYALLTFQGKNVLEGPGHALAGYLSTRSLNNLELSLLKICIECRLSQSLVLGAYSYSQDTKNTYLLDSAKTGWEKLDCISNVKNEDLLQKWKEIEKLYKQ